MWSSGHGGSDYRDIGRCELSTPGGMRLQRQRFFVTVFLPLLLLLVSCADPVERRVRITKAELLRGTEVSASARIHTFDGSVYLARKGFTIRNDTISGSAQKYDLTRLSDSEREWQIPIDSVAGVEYFAVEMPGLREVGNAVSATTFTVYSLAGSLVLLKALFGSCPTFYTYDGEAPVLEAEGFSYSIGKYFEAGDLDRLHVDPSSGAPLRLDIRNEALETHYINQVEVRYLDHPAGTEAYPGVEPGTVHILKPRPPVSAVTMSGRNVLGAVIRRDAESHESDEETTSGLLPKGTLDYIECEFGNPGGSSVITVALRGRNTLQNTVLLYDVMMRNQGSLVLDWISKVNENPLYSWRLYRWYKEHSGVQVFVEHDGEFELAERISDTGPIAWKETAVQIPVDPGKKTVRVRFAFLPESWAIDWIGYDDQRYDVSELTGFAPAAATNNRETDNRSIVRLLGKDDDDYLPTYPGTIVHLTFEAPAARNPGARTFFVWSKGYYIEWVRGEWLKARDDVIVFDIRDPQKISRDLADFWRQKRSAIKEQFYVQKIPLR